MTNLYEGLIIEVKKGQFFDHPGIVTFKHGRWSVIHNSPIRGVVLSTYEEFSDGEVVRSSTRYDTEFHPTLVAQRALQKLGTPWAPWYNCQHFVSEMCGQKPWSHDWRWAIGLVAIAIVIGAASRRA